MNIRILILLCFLAPFSLLCGQGIQLNVTPAAQSIELGSTETFDVSVSPTGGFNQQIQLTVTSDLYLGTNNGEVNVQFSPNNLFAPYTGGSIMSVTVTSAVPLGSHWITVHAANGPVSATQTIPIEIIVDSCMWQKYGEPMTFFGSSAGMQKIVVDNNGVVWSGGCMGGLYKFDGANWIKYDNNTSNLPGIRVNDLKIAPDNALWIGTERGLARFDGTYWTIYDSINSPLSGYMITSIDYDINGDLWVGTGDYTLNQLVTAGNGIYKLSNGNWTHYTTSNSILTNNRIQKLRADRYGNIYILTANYGAGYSQMLKYDSTFHLLSSVNSVYQNIIQDFAIDTLGNLWLVTSAASTNNALVKFDGNCFEEWHYSGTTPYNHSVRDLSGHITLQDNASHIPSTRIYAVYVDSRNIVWVSLFANNPNNPDQGNGLYVLGATGYNHFNSFNSSLPYDGVYGIIEKDNTIWITTGWGELDGESPYKVVASMHCENIVRKLVSGVKEPQMQTGYVHVYPNPADNSLFIDVPVTDQATVTIYTATGQLIKEVRQVTSREIDVSDLSSGLYIAEIKSTNSVQRVRWLKL